MHAFNFRARRLKHTGAGFKLFEVGLSLTSKAKAEGRGRTSLGSNVYLNATYLKKKKHHVSTEH